jgi:hypothetical protein
MGNAISDADHKLVLESLDANPVEELEAGQVFDLFG